MLLYMLFFVTFMAAFAIARADRIEKQQEGHGRINHAEKTFISYFMASGIEKLKYESYYATIVLISFIISYLVYVIFDMWIVAIASWFVSFLLQKQVIIRKSYKLKLKIDQLCPNIIESISTSYAAHSQDVLAAVRQTMQDVSLQELRKPFIDLVDGIESGLDPLEHAKTIKLHFRNHLIKHLIDAIAEEIVFGGLFQQKLADLAQEAEDQNEMESQTKNATIDSVLASNFVVGLTVVVILTVIIFAPQVIVSFKKTPIGNSIITLTIVLLGFNVIVADNKARSKE